MPKKRQTELPPPPPHPPRLLALFVVVVVVTVLVEETNTDSVLVLHVFVAWRRGLPWNPVHVHIKNKRNFQLLVVVTWAYFRTLEVKFVIKSVRSFVSITVPNMSAQQLRTLSPTVIFCELSYSRKWTRQPRKTPWRNTSQQRLFAGDDTRQLFEEDSKTMKLKEPKSQKTQKNRNPDTVGNRSMQFVNLTCDYLSTSEKLSVS